jgi:hypothetical protein
VSKKRKKRKQTTAVQVTSLINSIVSSLGGEITLVKPIKDPSNDPVVLESVRASLQKLSQKLFPNTHRQELRDSNTRETLQDSILCCARSHSLIQDSTTNVKIATNKLIDDYESLKVTKQEKQKENEFWISFGQFAADWIQ